MNKRVISLIAFATLLPMVQGCAPSVYAVDRPEPSAYIFMPGESTDVSQLNFVDARADAYTTFSSGSLPMGLTYEGESLKPVSFVAEFTLAELAARGIAVEAGGGDAVEIRINKVVMRNYRATGFSPFTTVTMLSADAITPKGDRRIGAFMVRGKVPVWSFNEVIEPTLNQPLELLVQDLAAKINMHLYQQSASDAVVQELIAKVNSAPDDGLAYLSVYQLGFSNNPSAIGALVEMTKSPHEYIRCAAISSLGTINAHDQVDYLISIFLGDGIWQDKAMAVKALGDIAVMGNDQAMTFMRENVEDALAGETAAGAEWTREILGLYLRS